MCEKAIRMNVDIEIAYQRLSCNAEMNESGINAISSTEHCHCSTGSSTIMTTVYF